jgi:hypothetical protein
LLIVGVSLLILVGAGKRTLNPLVRGYEAARELRQLEAERLQLEAEAQKLTEDLEALQTPRGQACAGKKAGLYRPGERELQVDVKRLRQAVAAAERPAQATWSGHLRVVLDAASRRGRELGATVALWLLDVSTDKGAGPHRP